MTPGMQLRKASFQIQGDKIMYNIQSEIRSGEKNNFNKSWQIFITKVRIQYGGKGMLNVFIFVATLLCDSLKNAVVTDSSDHVMMEATLVSPVLVLGIL